MPGLGGHAPLSQPPRSQQLSLPRAQKLPEAATRNRGTHGEPPGNRVVDAGLAPDVSFRDLDAAVAQLAER